MIETTTTEPPETPAPNGSGVGVQRLVRSLLMLAFGVVASIILLPFIGIGGVVEEWKRDDWKV